MLFSVYIGIKSPVKIEHYVGQKQKQQEPMG